MNYQAVTCNITNLNKIFVIYIIIIIKLKKNSKFKIFYFYISKYFNYLYVILLKFAIAKFLVLILYYKLSKI